MAERGEIEPFHCAIFADTGWESQGTYDWIAYLKQMGRTPIITVMGKYGSIYEHSIDATTRRRMAIKTNNCGVAMPVYLSGGGIGKRQCTDNWKIQPIKQETRRLLGLVPKQRAPKDCVDQIVGISLDEAQRMKPSRERSTRLSYPLVHLNMTRHDCMNWLTRNGYPIPPKSSCVGCPFHSNNEWRAVRKNPIEWQQAVALDNRIRSIDGFRGNLYLHRSCKPLEEVDLSTPEERGQGVFDFIKEEKLNLFVNNLSIY
jgi:hypothetical protein